MDGGRIAQEGTPQELYESPASRFLADFIGDANLVDGEVQRSDGAATFVAGGVGATVASPRVDSGPATLAVRPQRLRVVDAGEGVVQGVCKRVAYLGSRIEYVVGTPWGELLVFDPNVGQRRAREAAVGIAFDPDAVIVLPRSAS
jgi:iron(III) transport system ATP-binding protein